jgi:hypothetical protein
MVDVAEAHSADSSHAIASQRRKKETCKEPGSSAKILTATLDPGEIPFHCELHPYMIGSSCNILCFIDWAFIFAPCLTNTETVSLSYSPAGFVTVNLNAIVVSDRKSTSYNDIFDAFRLALKFYRYQEVT